ncbi:MAG: hypothetical protein ACR2N1_25285 [Rubripirellula sp.]
MSSIINSLLTKQGMLLSRKPTISSEIPTGAGKQERSQAACGMEIASTGMFPKSSKNRNLPPCASDGRKMLRTRGQAMQRVVARGTQIAPHVLSNGTTLTRRASGVLVSGVLVSDGIASGVLHQLFTPLVAFGAQRL